MYKRKRWVIFQFSFISLNSKINILFQLKTYELSITITIPKSSTTHYKQKSILSEVWMYLEATVLMNINMIDSNIIKSNSLNFKSLKLFSIINHISKWEFIKTNSSGINNKNCIRYSLSIYLLNVYWRPSIIRNSINKLMNKFYYFTKCELFL